LAVDKDGLPYLAHPEKCTLCKLCELRCPDFAITVREREKKEKNKVAKQN
jgi:2-oxoglutarate ferredoxin oxidoreductase subunit delta